MNENEYLMHNGSREAAEELAKLTPPIILADRIVRLEAGFATIMQAYDDPKGDLRHTVAAAIWALFPPPNESSSATGGAQPTSKS